MTRADRGAVLDLLEHAFGIRELFERYMDFDPEFSYGDVLLALEGGGAPVACVQVFSKTIRLRGRAVRLGGIGSVATRASQRGSGLATDLLERALEQMRARDMAISLLFAAPVAPLYERLGWRKIPAPILRLARAQAPDSPAPGWDFQPADLERVSAVYDAFTAPLSGPTLRDARYWRGQLHTAGTPSETFRLAHGEGRELAAYVRTASFNGRIRVLEYARAPNAADSLAALLAAAIPDGQPLYAPFVHDPDLAAALESRAVSIRLAADPSPMWRVLDRPTLAGIANLPGDASDTDILISLIERPRATYWPSDRF